MDMLEARKQLEEAIKSGQAAHDQAPTRLPLDAIIEKRSLFQHRMPQPHASECHIKDLGKAPMAGIDLDPLTVFWAGLGYVLIDGHHRLAAYRGAQWKRDIPVQVFSGSLDEAIAYAGKSNSGAKLTMSRAEKQGLAWRLTCGTSLSREKTVRASGVSDGVVAEMRRVKTRLTKEMGTPLKDVSNLAWWKAKQLSSGNAQEMEEIDFDQRREHEAQDLANKLVKHLGKHDFLRHETLARALEIYDKRLPAALSEYWGPGDDDWGLGPDPEAEEETPNPDF